MRFIPLYSILACIALVFSQTDTSSENLFANQPDNSNLFLDDNSSGGLYSMDPTVPDDGALMHSNPLDAPDDSSLLMNSNLPADVPDNSALLMNPTLLTAADAPNKGCSDPLPAWNKIRARQTSCPNPDDDGVVLEGKKSILTDEEVKKHWCPEASGPFRGFGNIPVCYRRETFLGPLAGYYPFLENVELITTLVFDSCQSKNVWCCNAFLENLGYADEVLLIYPPPVVPPGTGYWCVKAYPLEP